VRSINNPKLLNSILTDPELVSLYIPDIDFFKVYTNELGSLALNGTKFKYFPHNKIRPALVYDFNEKTSLTMRGTTTPNIFKNTDFTNHVGFKLSVKGLAYDQYFGQGVINSRSNFTLSDWVSKDPLLKHDNPIVLNCAKASFFDSLVNNKTYITRGPTNRIDNFEKFD
jgi:hypothetical protein